MQPNHALHRTWLAVGFCERLCAAFLLLFGLGCSGDAPLEEESGPATWPTGSNTPEGAACDLARSFINKDVPLFRSVCVKPMGEGKSVDDYESFIDNMLSDFERAKANPEAAHGPVSITKVYTARSLARNGPASTAYALFGFHDVKFVDLVTQNDNGDPFLCRTLVLMDRGGKWQVLPLPQAYPLLSMGLNDESPSTQEYVPKEGTDER